MMATVSENLRELADALEPVAARDPSRSPSLGILCDTTDHVDEIARALHLRVETDGAHTDASGWAHGVYVLASCYIPPVPVSRSVVADYTEASL